MQFHRVGNDVGGLARVDHRHRNDGRVDGFDVAADDGLKRLHQLARHRHGVERVVRHGGVAALTLNGDPEFVAGGHDRAGAGSEMPCRHAWPVVQAKHGLHRELVKETVLDHLARAAATFFCGLEDQVHSAVEVTVCGQILRSGQQHGGVAIVATGVHLARHSTGVGKGVALLHRQRVHVGAQPDGAAGRARLDATHHAGGTQAAVDGNAPVGQLLRNDVGGAQLLETQFRVGVDITAQGGDGVALPSDGINQFHSY